MPFKSKRQLQTCFAKELIEESKNRKSKWDCTKFLTETLDPSCLPMKIDSPSHRTCNSNKSFSKKEIGPVYIGPRGGYYFYAGGVKIYVPHGTEKEAIRKYGLAK